MRTDANGIGIELEDRVPAMPVGAAARVLPKCAAEVFRGGDELLGRFGDPWRELCASLPQDEPFLRPEWTSAYLQAFAKRSPLTLVAVRDGDRISGLLPLVEERKIYAGVPLRMLRTAQNIHVTRSDVLLRTEHPEASSAAVWQALQNLRWDAIEFQCVAQNGEVTRLLDLAARDGYSVQHWEIRRDPYIDLTAPASDAISLANNPHFRQNLRRRIRKLSAQGSLKLRRFDSADDGVLNEFFRLEASGWKGRRRSAIACSPATVRFYREIARAAAAAGYLALYFLECDGRYIAAHFGLEYRNRYYSAKVAYEDGFAAYSPGHVILAEILGDCLRRGVKEFDFAGAAEPWKMEWASGTRTECRALIFNKSAIAAAANVAVRQKRRLLSVLLGMRDRRLARRLPRLIDRIRSLVSR